jgi:hypothetical protein
MYIAEKGLAQAAADVTNDPGTILGSYVQVWPKVPEGATTNPTELGDAVVNGPTADFAYTVTINATGTQVVIAAGE